MNVTTLRQWWHDFWVYEPVVQQWAVNGGLVLFLAYVLHWGHTREAAAATIITAVTAAVTAFRARPVNLSVFVGIFGTIVTAIGTFGYHVPPHTIAMIEGGAAIAIMLLTRVHTESVAGPKPVRSKPPR